ncbi:MAG: TIR domain-containing protein [Bryobacterales bacterium]|nr:TIR domain-containing protein [Bryobacterales bacterium]
MKRLRKARGLTLRAVETETGISNAYLSQLETGKAENPSASMLKKLADLYRASSQALMQQAGYLPIVRDVFLSHRSANKDFVRELATDIESEAYEERRLMTWLDEAEIRPGDSIPGAITRGLEQSRFIAIVMTPEYFATGSGWTDAEWHAAFAR